MEDRRVGIFSTSPVEVLLAAGLRPMDVNNAFIIAPDRLDLLAQAESAGLPRTSCAWTRGLYAATLALGFSRILVVTDGDCSANRAMAELLRDLGVEVIEFRYPLANRSVAAVNSAMADLAAQLGTTLDAAEAVRRELAPLRAGLERLDRFTWDEGKVTAEENHRWLVQSSDLGGDAVAYHNDLMAFIESASRRNAAGEGPRLGLFGVPPALTDLHDAMDAAGARVVFNEIASDFAMIPPADSLGAQYSRYAYPYGIRARVARARIEAERRGLEGWLVYDQSFCYHNLETPAVDRLLGDLPRLHLEGDVPGPVAGRDRIRIEAFVRTITQPRQRPIRAATKPKAQVSSRPALGLDLGSRFAKVAFQDAAGHEEVRIIDSMSFYRTWARRGAAGLILDLPALLRDELGIQAPAGLLGVATGYGRHLDGLAGCRAVPEVHAHAAGAAAQVGSGEFLLADLGGQDTKGIRVRNGTVVDFVMNDRCAAGSGRYVENMALLLEMDLDEVLRHHADPVVLSNVCATFGESEVVSFVVDGVPVERICAGILRSVAMRLLQLLGRIPDVSDLPLYLSGGLAESPGLVYLLDVAWKGHVKALPRPRLSGALGCLELAAERSTP